MSDGSSSAAITDDDLDGLRGTLDGDALVSGDSAWSTSARCGPSRSGDSICVA